MDQDGLDDLIVHSLGGTAGTVWILPGSGL